VFAQGADVVYAAIGGGVYLIHILIRGLEFARQYAGYSSLSRATRAGKEESVGHALIGYGVFQGLDYMILADDF
jgi:hypothetical protein